MKQKLLSKMLLVAIMLLGGVNSAWGSTVWKTYKTWDFTTSYAAGDVSGLLPSGSWETSGSGTSTVAKTSQNISSATAVTTSISNRYYGLLFQGETNKLQFGKTGVVLGGASTLVTIPNLKAGQRVTVTIDNSNGVETHSSSVATLTGVTTTQSGNYYKTVGVVGASGNLVIKRVNTTTFRIRSILVETPIVDAVYTQEFTGVTELPSDWTNNCSAPTFNNNMSIPLPSGNSRNGFLDIRTSVSNLTGDNWSITFKTSMKPGSGSNSQSGQEIAVWGTKSSMKASNKTYLVSSNGAVGYHITEQNAFFQAYNTTAGGTTYTVYFADNAMETVTLEESEEYIFTVHCTNIDTENKTADLQVIIIKASTGAEVYNKSHSISTDKTGTLGGLFFLNARYNSVTTFDDIYLTQSDFTLSEDYKNLLIGNNGTITVSNISGDISVASSNESIATVSYSAGTVTITGVASGNATVTVYCANNGVVTSKTIDVTVSDYSGVYAAEKAVYDAKVDNLDSDGQTYWTANVTPVASVTDEASYNAAVAALPTTYVAAVKAQTTKGSDMTEAMPTGNAGWTCGQGNGPKTVKDTFTETYGDASAFVEGNIMSQTITGLPNGYYKVQFYGVVNAAHSPSTLTENTDGLAQAYANSTNEEITVYYQDDCTPSNYLQTIEAQVTNGTLTYGLKAKDGVTDAGNWAVAKIYKLTYLGADKNTYTINAVADETKIKELATGSVWASETYGVYIPKVILYNSKYYVLDDGENANLSNYYASYTMGASNETKEINYTLDETIVAFAESGSNISQSTSNNSSYSSGNYGHVKGQSSISLGTLAAGEYSFEAYYVSNSNRGLYLRNGNDNNLNTNTIVYQTLSSAGVVSVDFTLPSSTPIFFSGYTNQWTQYNQSAEFDYVIIRKTADLPTTESIVVTSAGYATYVSNYNLDFTSATTKAYKVNVASKGEATLTEVSKVPAKTPVLLYVSGGNGEGEAIPVTTDAVSAVSDNDLVAGTGAAVATTVDTYTNMILNNVDNNIGFYFANNKTVAANRAYLHIATTLAPNVQQSRMKMAFAGETTGIGDAARLKDKGQMINDKVVFNLNGQRVKKAAKGLYIVNGKKYVK